MSDERIAALEAQVATLEEIVKTLRYELNVSMNNAGASFGELYRHTGAPNRNIRVDLAGEEDNAQGMLIAGAKAGFVTI